MADDAHIVKACAEQLDAGIRVILEILSRAVVDVTRIAADAPVVIAQGGNACPGEGIRNDGERLMLKDLLVAVLLAAAGHHQQHWSRSGTGLRQDKGPLESDIAIEESKLLADIGERPHGRLRARKLLLPGRKGQWQ